jgi:phage baseplate assembly protein W
MILSPKKAIGLSLPIKLGNEGYFITNKDDISQVSDNIKNLLSTIPGERRFNNSFGSSLYNLLFNSIDNDITENIIIDSVQRDIDRFVPNVTVTNVRVMKEPLNNNTKNTIFISVQFIYRNDVGNTTLTIENNTL